MTSFSCLSELTLFTFKKM